MMIQVYLSDVLEAYGEYSTYGNYEDTNTDND